MLAFRPLALLPSISALSILATAAFYFVLAQKKPLLLTFLLYQAVLFLWPFGQALQYLATGEPLVIFTVYVIHTSINFVGIAWLMFALHFTAADGTAIPARWTLLAVPPLLAYVIFLTNPLHHLYFRTLGYDPRIIIAVSYGPFFWLTAVITYGYVIAAAVILARHAARQTGYTKGQAGILVFSPLLPLAVSMASSGYMLAAGIRVPESFDLTPTLFSMTVILCSIAVFKFRFLDVVPGAFKKTFESLHDSILVIDNSDCIANSNRSFAASFGGCRPHETAGSLTARLRLAVVPDGESGRILDAVERGTDGPVEKGKVILAGSPRRTFRVIVQALEPGKRNQRGRIVTFHDITEVEELAVARERHRVSREMHDTMGHSLTVLIMLMKAARIEVENSRHGAAEKLAEGIKVAQAELNELRASISGLLTKEVSSLDVLEGVESLGRYLETLGVNVQFSVVGKDFYDGMSSSVRKFRLSDAIYKISKEGITNSLRHGGATEIHIIARFCGQKADLFIIDNGCGCRQVISGTGLSGMTARVQELGGSIKFGSDGVSGFHIHAEFPMEEAAGGQDTAG